MAQKIHIAIREGALDATPAFAFVSDASHGAIASFVGVVRNHHEGRAVSGMIYDCHDGLAEKALLEICHEAINLWDDVHIFVEHAKGTLKVGDASVVIAVGSPHRANAFDACRFIIEEIKKRVPVWKQELYIDGTQAWLGGSKLDIPQTKTGCGCGGCGCGGR
ncbi:MAG: molybdenum cofactor biosynthesis protein MoaE [Rhodospirillales bacterium]|nr:molybdenum cofactor biosynthesis protein MoaE [Alphaproteobacteria bacterium]MCB9986815.1 molybdenum cofactor biosynthesis protein MoaE [Rhodospirillales bacterium]USO08420.1 MAG: molybdenum cofactor biosynthesis protein MoaE [Rhodospirillales bacterium]